jgi:hypothetical protein
MTYNELSVYGRLRKIECVIIKCLQGLIIANTMNNSKLGVYGMWEKLLHVWGETLSPQQI